MVGAATMAQPLVRAPANPALDGVQFSEGSLGKGSYGSVCKASIPCAAKMIHKILTENPELRRNQERFEQECRILSECRHPNIVQYLGLSSNPRTGQTALLMELMDETLTRFLEVRYKTRDVPYYMQVNISRDIANGVSFLHSKGIIHRDLSSNNVLLKGTYFTAKISDFGMSMLKDLKRDRLTECPGTAVYMPPEAFHLATKYSEKIDCFQMGVLMLQIVTREYPKPTDRFIRRPNPQAPAGFSLDLVPERERRKNHLQPLYAVEHQMLDNPILECLKDKEEDRPSAQHVFEYLTQLTHDQKYLDDRQNHLDDRQNHPQRHDIGHDVEEQFHEGRIQSLQQEKQRLEMELERELERKHHDQVQMRSLQEEKQTLQWQLGQKVMETEQLVAQIKEYEHRLQFQTSTAMQQTQQRDQLHRELQHMAQSYDSRIANMEQRFLQEEQLLQRQLAEKTQQLQKKDEEIERFVANHTCRILTPQVKSVTANHAGCMKFELCASDGKPCTVNHNTPITATLSPPANSTANSPADCDIKPLDKHFEVCYEPSIPGQYQLSIKLRNREIYGMSICVYPDPTPPHHLVPVSFIAHLKSPYGITVTRRRQILVCEYNGNKVSVYDIDAPKKEKRYLGGPDLMTKPRGVATDDAGNVYITSEHKVQKYSDTFALLKSKGNEEGEKNEEFHFPSGLTVHQNEVYVCDQLNNRVQIFDLDLKFVRSIDELDSPSDIDFDQQGRMLVAEHGKKVLQVMTRDGQKIQVIGRDQDMKPDAVHVVNEYIYVSDFNRQQVIVFHSSGKYVTSLGRKGHREGEWCDPKGITSWEGQIYVCGSEDGRVHKLKS